MKTSFSSIHELSEKIGREVSVSDWLTIHQDRIDRFADATNDRQWIHVDTERAKREAPNGQTIAHGYLTLSLVAGFADESLQIANVSRVINYGLNKVRFITPVSVGSRLRAHFAVGEFAKVQEGAFQILWQVRVEIEGVERPACVAEIIFRYYL